MFSKVPCFSDAARQAQTRLRAAWFDDGFNKLSEAELVFLDPDNGLAASRCKKHLRSTAKYIFEDEVAAWLKRGQSVVLYQHHQPRSLSEQVSEQQQILASGNPAMPSVSIDAPRESTTSFPQKIMNTESPSD